MNPKEDVVSDAVDSQPGSPCPFQKVFTVGVLGWLIGMFVALGMSFVISNPNNLASALIWTISHWVKAYAFGLVLMVGFAMIKRAAIGAALLAYVLPMAVLSAVAWGCHSIYPDVSFRGDLFTYLPVVLNFYIFGCLWMAIQRERENSSVFLRAMMPPILGGGIILALVAIPVFLSNAFIYRNAFGFSINKVTLQDNTLISEGSITIHKPGDYHFTSPRYYCNDLEMLSESEDGVELGKITWGEAGAPKSGSVGEYPVTIAWNKAVLPNAATAPSAASKDSVYIEVRTPGSESELLYFLNTPVHSP